MQAGEGAQAAPARPLLQDGNTLIDGETGVLDACGQPKSNMARLVAPPASVA